MSTAAGMSISQGFSKPSVHSLTYKDNFCSFASNLREELLHYPKWKEMQQDALSGGGKFVPQRQNGITTGHLREEDRERLPFCWKFGDFLKQNFGVLCPIVGVDPADALYLEMNAMAYGAGAWLAPHTDFFEYGHTVNRLAAWMLYLTAPEDGEWSPEKGGAVRVWAPGNGEERIRPRFNRFAMFRVQDNSFHEIEKITWEPEWPNCRIAISGWIQGPPLEQVPRKTRLYAQSLSVQQNKEEMEAFLQGSLALHRLLAKQKTYCGGDIANSVGRIAELELDYQAHREAPPGTSFLRRVPGPAGCIIVVNEAGDTIYFGTPEGYEKKLRSQSDAP